MYTMLENAIMGKKQRVTIALFGLSCGGGGSLTIERALAKLPGVIRVYVNPATEMAYVEFNSELCRLDKFEAAIKEAGFEAGEPTLR